jgi:hypothetical protein
VRIGISSRSNRRFVRGLRPVSNRSARPPGPWPVGGIQRQRRVSNAGRSPTQDSPG